jgi:hypothetical protein
VWEIEDRFIFQKFEFIVNPYPIFLSNSEQALEYLVYLGGITPHHL